MDLYFAYGMNLDPSWMHGAEFEVGPALLRGYRLRFERFADVVATGGDQDDVVHGALWRVEPDHLAWLDQREGYHNRPDDLYTRELLSVEAQRMGNIVCHAWIYSLRNKKTDIPPSGGYLNMIKRGYAHFGLPMEALECAIG